MGAFWGARLGMWSFRMVPVAFLASGALYCGSIEIIRGGHVCDLDSSDEWRKHAAHKDFEDYPNCVERLLYTWFNVNPVHVLKCHHYPEDMVSSGDVINEDVVSEVQEKPAPFEYGKEY